MDGNCAHDTKPTNRELSSANDTAKRGETTEHLRKTKQVDAPCDEDATDEVSLALKEDAFVRVVAAEGELASKRPLLRPRLFTGLAALCVAVVCVFFALVVLLVSNGSQVDNWPVQPSVYLGELQMSAFWHPETGIART